jgi:hypothetical protein
MSQIQYQIDNTTHFIEVDDSTEWISGKNSSLSSKKSDPTYNLPWYNKQAFLFSPFLIHRLALNQQEDTTRIALEFRLFKQ